MVSCVANVFPMKEHDVVLLLGMREGFEKGRKVGSENSFHAQGVEQKCALVSSEGGTIGTEGGPGTPAVSIDVVREIWRFLVLRRLID